MLVEGKGFFIWKIPACEGGDVKAIANLAQKAGLSHVLIKIANGSLSYNIDSEKNDLVIPLVKALKNRIQIILRFICATFFIRPWVLNT